MAWNDVLDAQSRRSGYADSVAIDLQDVGEPTTPLTVDLSDAWETLADGVALASDFLVRPSDDANAIADSLAAARDLRAAALSDLNGWSDDRSVLLHHAADLADVLETLGDDFVWSQSAPLTADYPADANAEYTDDLDLFVDYLIRLDSDANAVADTLDADFTLSVALDSALDTWVDALGTGGIAALTAEFVDIKDEFLDELAVGGTAALVYEATDIKDEIVDALAIIRGLLVDETDTARTTPLTISLTDARPAFADSLNAVAAQIDARTVSLTDALGTPADSAAVTLGLLLDVHEPTVIEWTWTDEGGGTPDGFRVYRGATSGIYSAYYEIADLNARSVDITTAVPPGEWYVAVAAYNATGISAYSNEILISYAVYGDSVASDSRWFNLTDAKPQFADSLSVRLALRVQPDADARPAIADALAAREALRAGVAADDHNGYADSVEAGGAGNYLIAFAESLAAADSLAVERAENVDLSDDLGGYADSVAKTLGSYVDTALEVDLSDALGGYADSLDAIAPGVDDIRVALASDLGGGADALAAALHYAAELAPDVCTDYGDAVSWEDVDRRAELSDAMAGLDDALGVTRTASLPTWGRCHDLGPRYRLRELGPRYRLRELLARYTVRERR